MRQRKECGEDSLSEEFRKISPSGTLTALHYFMGAADGTAPMAPLIVGTDGALYGSTFSGTNNAGTIFRITPDGQLTGLHIFGNVPGDGYNANGLLLASDGNFYGTTQNGGPSRVRSGPFVRLGVHWRRVP